MATRPEIADIALLPCPFCGRNPISFESGGGEGLMIQCISVGCPVGPHVSYIPPEAAIAAWNTRAKESEHGL